MARSRRQLALMRKPAKPGDASPPLGSRREFLATLARFNTGPDGSPQKPGSATEFLFGPGIIIELPTSADTVNQAMVTLNDEDIAWPVLTRLCKELNWTMVDLDSGRTFG